MLLIPDLFIMQDRRGPFPANNYESEAVMQERNVHLQSSVRLESYEEKRAKVRQFNLTSDIFFGKVMEDKAACQELIRILTKEKLTVKEVKTQYSIRNVENHSVVLDVLAEDENGKVINVEIHPQEDEDHVKRVRYYLGSIPSGGSCVHPEGEEGRS